MNIDNKISKSLYFIGLIAVKLDNFYSVVSSWFSFYKFLLGCSVFFLFFGCFLFGGARLGFICSRDGLPSILTERGSPSNLSFGLMFRVPNLWFVYIDVQEKYSFEELN